MSGYKKTGPEPVTDNYTGNDGKPHTYVAIATIKVRVRLPMDCAAHLRLTIAVSADPVTSFSSDIQKLLRGPGESTVQESLERTPEVLCFLFQIQVLIDLNQFFKPNLIFSNIAHLQRATSSFNQKA